MNIEVKEHTTIKILRIIIGLLFIASSILKMTDLILFEETIELFNIFPQYSKLLAIAIPSFELVSGIFLVLGIFKKAAAIVLSSLTLVFTFAIWLNLIEGYIFDCGCFGPLEFFSKVSNLNYS